jgi:PIN domain nuclease of toxin-antitoxin system
MTAPLLLDTHVLLWWLTHPRRLSVTARAQIERRACSASVMSLWEVAVKHHRGRLGISAEDLTRAAAASGIAWLPLTLGHVQSAAAIGADHGDPADRLIVGTARSERLCLVTRDAALLEWAAPLLGPLLLEA